MFPFNFFKKKERVVVNYNSEDLNDNEKLQSIFNENAYLKGKLARIRAEEENRKEKSKEEDKEKEKIEYLNKEVENIREKDIKPFSLFTLISSSNSFICSSCSLIILFNFSRFKFLSSLICLLK